MKTMKKRSHVVVVASVVAFGATVMLRGLLQAQQPAQPAQAPPPPMSFFVTSVGSGQGANLGGLAGADKHCQTLATAAGSTGKTWRAYLSTQGAGAVNARDRIGKGPWFNARGARIAQDVTELHGDTLDQARRGTNLTKVTAVTEKGDTVNGVGDKPNTHDMLTGSQLDGNAFTDAMDHTCNNWTSNATGTAQLGHHDRTGGGGTSWNSQHASKGCSQENLVATGGAGLFYCFATD